jgi:uncharacterized membrane protein
MQIKNKSSTTQRIFELDFLRGTLIILMCVDHLFYFMLNYVSWGIWDPNGKSTAIQNLGIMAYDTIRGTPVEYIFLRVAWCVYFFLSRSEERRVGKECRR